MNERRAANVNGDYVQGQSTIVSTFKGGLHIGWVSHTEEKILKIRE